LYFKHLHASNHARPDNDGGAAGTDDHDSAPNDSRIDSRNIVGVHVDTDSADDDRFDLKIGDR
jgi:hypothetical protein